jgi:hypothetical protein
MTFTEADHAKAVELYKTYKDAEWWPKTVQRRHHDGLDAEHWHDGSEFDGWCHPLHALSAIAWAMVERLGNVNMVEYGHRIGIVSVNGFEASLTRFLALAAAVEGMDAVP